MAGHEVLSALAGRGLRAFYVWTPVLTPDDRDAAVRAAGKRDHRAATHYWDEDTRFALHLAEPLGLTTAETPTPRSSAAIAWDVYLAYPAGDANLYTPSHWTHQLATTRVPRLNPTAFRREVEGLLGS